MRPDVAQLDPPPNPSALPPAGAPDPDVSTLYREIGLLAAPSPVAFVGKISSFASAFPDTTLVLVSISIPNRALTFTREAERYRAPYEVKLSLNRGDVEAATVNAMEIVRVGSFRRYQGNGDPARLRKACRLNLTLSQFHRHHPPQSRSRKTSCQRRQVPNSARARLCQYRVRPS